jgi:hypothetical protein
VKKTIQEHLHMKSVLFWRTKSTTSQEAHRKIVNAVKYLGEFGSISESYQVKNLGAHIARSEEKAKDKTFPVSTFVRRR